MCLYLYIYLYIYIYIYFYLYSYRQSQIDHCFVFFKIFLLIFFKLFYSFFSNFSITFFKNFGAMQNESDISEMVQLYNIRFSENILAEFSSVRKRTKGVAVDFEIQK